MLSYVRRGEEHTDKEGLEEACVDNGEITLVPHALSFPDTKPKLASSSCEEGQGDDLEDETSHHDVLA